MVEPGHPVLRVKELEQVGMVVGNIDERMETMWNTFGIGPWDVYVFSPDVLTDVKYYGKPSRSGMKVARAKIGPMEIELIEPIGDDNVYRDFVDRFGDGIQHLGWHKAESKEAVSEAIEKLEKAGFPCIWTGVTYRSAFAYFDTTKALNTILEVIWFDASITPSPTYTYPK